MSSVEKLVGVTQVAELLGVSKQRASQIVRQKGFPDPAAMLGKRSAWRRADVLRWGRRHGYRPEAKQTANG
jgi:predicted DNA-binding transcriptional regulator AlpA